MTFNIYGRHGIMEMIDFPALKTQLGYGKSVTTNPSWLRVCVVQIKFSVHPPPWLKHKWFGVFKMNFSTELVIMGDMEFTQVFHTMKCWLFIR
jgi:hypothetical protein